MCPFITAIGTLLMDQKVLAGVGNVYRAEILFRHRVSPFRPGKAVDEALNSSPPQKESI